MSLTATAVRTEPRYLRDYQQAAVDAALTTFSASETRLTILSACGTGKTVTMLALHEMLESQLTGFFCPNLSLLQQTVARWREFTGDGFRALIVCSDPDVGKASVDDISEAELRCELPDIEVTQDVTRVAEFLDEARSRIFDHRPYIVFGTYQSSHKVATAQTFTTVEFDLVVADEAHYLGTRDRKRGATDRTGEAVRDGELIRSARRVFTTATQRTVTVGRTAGSTESHASMDNPDIFGPVRSSWACVTPLSFRRSTGCRFSRITACSSWR